jgi:hypothetical protein
MSTNLLAGDAILPSQAKRRAKATTFEIQIKTLTVEIAFEE